MKLHRMKKILYPKTNPGYTIGIIIAITENYENVVVGVIHWDESNTAW